MILFFCALLGYLLGSIPFGLVLTRFFSKQDIREIGSGNIGATNVLRSGRKDLAAATLILDMLKGTLAVYLAFKWGGQDAGLVAGAFALLGHIFPVWLQFKGGKGVATFLGVLLIVHPKTAGIFIITWLTLAFLLRYSSLAALVAVALAPLVLIICDLHKEGVVFLFLAVLVFYKHNENIVRLMQGTESKIGQKSSPSDEA